MDAIFTGTVGATEENALCFHTVTNDLTSAVSALGRQRVDCAFETIEYMCGSTHSHLETFVIFVAANFTNIRDQAFCCWHNTPLSILFMLHLRLDFCAASLHGDRSSIQFFN